MKKSDRNDPANPFENYLKKLERRQKQKKAINPVHEIVNCYYEINGWEKMPKKFYTGRYAYNKLAHEAKLLYQACGENLDDAIWALDRMKYLAEKGGFDWSIITCLKHKL